MANPPTFEELIALAAQNRPPPENWRESLTSLPRSHRAALEATRPPPSHDLVPQRTIKPGSLFGDMLGLEAPPTQEPVEQPTDQPPPPEIQSLYELFEGAPSTGVGAAPVPFTPIEEEKDPWGGVLGTPLRGIAKGAGQTAISMGEGLLAMADVVTGSNIEGIDPDTSRAFEILQEAREFVGNEEGWVGKLSEALGSMALFAIPGLSQAGMAGWSARAAASGPAFLRTAKLTRNTARGLGAFKWSAAGSAGAGESSQMMAAFKEAGGDYTQGQRNLSIATGGLIGLTELLPIESVLRGFPKGNSTSWIVNKMTSAFVNGGMEGLQEAGAQVLQRINAKYIGGYNPDMDWFDSSLAEDFGYGAGAGAIFDLLLSGKGRRLNRPTQKQINEGYENTKLPDIASEESLQGSETINLFDKEGNLVKGTFEGIEGENARVRINNTGESISVPRDPQDGVGDQGFSLFVNQDIYTPKYRIGTVDENNQPSGSIEVGALSDVDLNQLFRQKTIDLAESSEPTSKQRADQFALYREITRRGINQRGTEEEGRPDEPTVPVDRAANAPVEGEAGYGTETSDPQAEGTEGILGRGLKEERTGKPAEKREAPEVETDPAEGILDHTDLYPDIKEGDEIDIFDASGTPYRTTVTGVSEAGSVKVLNQAGEEALLDEDLSATTINVNHPDYRLQSVGAAITKITGKTRVRLDELSDSQLSELESELDGRIKEYGPNVSAGKAGISDLNAIRLRRKRGATRDIPETTGPTPTASFKPRGNMLAPDIQSDIAYRRGKQGKNPSNIDQEKVAQEYGLNTDEFNALSKLYAQENSRLAKEDAQLQEEEIGPNKGAWPPFEIDSFSGFVNNHMVGKRVSDVEASLKQEGRPKISKKALKPLIESVTGNPSSTIESMDGDQRLQLISAINQEHDRRETKNTKTLSNIDFSIGEDGNRVLKVIDGVTGNLSKTIRLNPMDNVDIEINRLEQEFNLTEESINTARSKNRKLTPIIERLDQSLEQETIVNPETKQEISFASDVDKALHEVAEVPPKEKEAKARDKKYIRFLKRHFLSEGLTPSTRDLRAKGKRIKNDVVAPALAASPDSEIITVPLTETLPVTTGVTGKQIEDLISKIKGFNVDPMFIDYGIEFWRQNPDLIVEQIISEVVRIDGERGGHRSDEVIRPWSSVSEIVAKYKELGVDPRVWEAFWNRTGRILAPMEGAEGKIFEPVLGDPTDVDLKIAKRIANIIKKVAPNADGRVANSLFDEQGNPVLGRQVSNIVAVATTESEFADIENTSFHEATHYLLSNGFFTESQQEFIRSPETQASLRNIVRNLLGEDHYQNVFKDIEAGSENDVQELLAYTSGYYNSAMERHGEPPGALVNELKKGKLRRILDAIYYLFKRIGRFINGTDKDSLTAELGLLSPSALREQETRIRILLDKVRKGEIGTQEPIYYKDMSGDDPHSPRSMVHQGKAAAIQYNFSWKSEFTDFLEDPATQNIAKGFEWLETLNKKDKDGIPQRKGILASAIRSGKFKMAELLDTQIPDFLWKNSDERITKKQLLEELRNESRLVETQIVGIKEDDRISLKNQEAKAVLEDRRNEILFQYGRYATRMYPIRTLMSIFSSEIARAGTDTNLPSDIKEIYKKWGSYLDKTSMEMDPISGEWDSGSFGDYLGVTQELSGMLKSIETIEPPTAWFQTIRKMGLDPATELDIDSTLAVGGTGNLVIDLDPKFKKLFADAQEDLQKFLIERQISQQVSSSDIYSQIAEDGMKDDEYLSARTNTFALKFREPWQQKFMGQGPFPDIQVADGNISNYYKQYEEISGDIQTIETATYSLEGESPNLLEARGRAFLQDPTIDEAADEADAPFPRYTVWGERKYRDKLGGLIDPLQPKLTGPALTSKMIIISAPVSTAEEAIKISKMVRKSGVSPHEVNREYMTYGHTGNIKNPIVHARVSTIYTEDGKKVLVIDEIQSDLHQETGAIVKDSVASEFYNKRWKSLTRNEKNHLRDSGELGKEENRIYGAGPQALVPDLPFKRQHQWINLAINHVVRMAVDGGYDGITVANSNFQKERYWEQFKDHISGLTIHRTSWVEVEGAQVDPETDLSRDSDPDRERPQFGYKVSYSVPTNIGPINKGSDPVFKSDQEFNNWIGEDVANLIRYKAETEGNTYISDPGSDIGYEIPNIVEFINDTAQEVLDLQEKIESQEYVDPETVVLFNKYFSQTSRRNILAARRPDGSIDIPVGISGFVQMYDRQIPNQLRETLSRSLTGKDRKAYKDNKLMLWFGPSPTGAKIVSPEEVAGLPDISDYFPPVGSKEQQIHDELFGDEIAERMYEDEDQAPTLPPPDPYQAVSSVNNSSQYFPITREMVEIKGGTSGSNVVAYSMAALRNSGIKERNRLFNNTRTRISDWVESSVAQPLKGLYEREKYLLARGKFLGTIHKVEEFTIRLRNDLAPYLDKRNPYKRADAEPLRIALYDYMTTAPSKGEAAKLKSLEAIDKKVAQAAVRAKKVIEEIGQELVTKGLLPPDIFEENRRSYFPQMYLKHVLADPSGESLSYLKEQKIPIDDITKRNLYGDLSKLAPEFVIGRHIERSMRDLAFIEFLDSISIEKNWALPNDQLVATWIDPNTNKEMRNSVFWMYGAAKDFEKNAKYFMAGNENQAKEMLKTAKMLRDSAAPVLQKYAEKNRLEGVVNPDGSIDEVRLSQIKVDGLKVISGDGQTFKRIPNKQEYGKLAGMAVHSAVYDDVIAGISYTGWGDHAGTKLARAARKGTALWKAIKVPLNPPTVARNTFSNMILMHLSGVPMHRILPNMVKAGREISIYKKAVKNKNKMSEQEFAEAMEKSKHYREMMDRGVAEASFTESELYRFVEDIEELLNEVTIKDAGILNWLNIKTFRKILKNAGNLYQTIEVMGKTAIAIDMMDHQGSNADEAFLTAQKYLFDYSLVPPVVRWTRTNPIGIPFLTFYYKVFPILLDTAINRPFKFAPYVGMMLGLQALFKSNFDIDDEEYETVQNLLPEFARNNGGTFPLPIRDSKGRAQLVDLGYILPWGAFVGLANQAIRGIKQLEPGPQSEGINTKEIIQTLGLFGGPGAQGIAAGLTGIDPFTGMPIMREGDPLWVGGAQEEILQGRGKIADSLLYVANQFMLPGFLHTDYGASKRLIDASSGQRRATGGEGDTVTQAALKFIGLNIYSIDPKAASRIVYYAKQEIDNSVAAFTRMLNNQSLSDEEKRRRSVSYQEEIALQTHVFQQLLESVRPSSHLYGVLLSEEQHERE